MIRFIACVLIAQLFFSPSYAGLPYSVLGQFDDNLIRPERRGHIGLRQAVAIDKAGIIRNFRFYHGVEDPRPGAHLAELPEFPELKGVTPPNIREGSAPDHPVNLSSYIVQWLFPSPAGRHLVPHQGSTSDPVRYFTPKMIGTILNCIVGGVSVEDLHSVLNSQFSDLGGSEPKRAAKRPLLHFIQVLYQAIAEQSTQEDEEASLLPKAFLENVLFAFALRKAGNAEDQVAAMRSFYDAMPALVVEGWQPLSPFTYEGYRAIADRVKAGEFELPPEETFQLLCGLDEFAQLYPAQQHYSVTQHNGVSFPNCGEIFILNTLNGMLWDFETKRLRVELLEILPNVRPALIEYFRQFDSVEKQISHESQLAWTQVVSGLVGKDIFYKKGGHTCEISAGATSIFGVLRALFLDDVFQAINADEEMSPLERVQETIVHFLEIFTTEREVWSWSIEGADAGMENIFNKNVDITVKLSKEGVNVPCVDGEPLHDPVLSWEILKGHYEATFSRSSAADFMEEFASKAILRDLGEDAATKQVVTLDPLNLWAISEYFDWGTILSHLAQPYTLEEMEDDPYVFEAYHSMLNDNYLRSFLQKTILLGDYAQHMKRVLVFLNTVDLKFAPLYVLAANVLHEMPERNPYSTMSCLMQALTPDGGLNPELRDVHPRIAARAESTLREIEDTEYAYSCLVDVGGDSKTFLYVLNKIPPGSLDREQLLKLLYAMAPDDEYGPDVWDAVLESFGELLHDEDSQVDPSQFMGYRPDKAANSFEEILLEGASIETLEHFVDLGFLTTETLLGRQANELPNINILLANHHRVYKMLRLVRKLGINKAVLEEASPIFFNTLFRIVSGDFTQYQQAIDELALTKDDFLKPLIAEDGSSCVGILGQMTQDDLEERIVHIIQHLDIRAAEVQAAWGELEGSPYETLVLNLMVYSPMEAIPALVDRGFITQETLFAPHENGPYILTLFQQPDRLLVVCKSLGLTKDDLWQHAPRLLPMVFSVEGASEEKLLAIIHELALTKEDFLKPLPGEDADQDPGAMFYSFMRCLANGMLIVRTAEITAEEIRQAAEPFLASQKIPEDYLQGMIDVLWP